jgi:hypothetical protein
MSSAAQALIDAFDQLTSQERGEVAGEILRRAADADYPPLDDETIDRIADESFLEYDDREAVQVESSAGRSLDG